MQVIMSVIIFVLLGSEDHFSTKWEHEKLGAASGRPAHKGGNGSHEGNVLTPSLYNGLFSTISFLLGAVTSIASGYLGMKIATYANARVTVQARKGIAPAFEAGTFAFLLFIVYSSMSSSDKGNPWKRHRLSLAIPGHDRLNA
jgi:hypothetical protein